MQEAGVMRRTIIVLMTFAACDAIDSASLIKFPLPNFV